MTDILQKITIILQNISFITKGGLTMKTMKFTLLVVMSLVTCFILNACGTKQESSADTSSQTTKSTSSATKPESQSSSVGTSSETQKENTVLSSATDKSKDSSNQQLGFNFDELAQGNFASLAGTWQNDKGDKLVIYNNGTTDKNGDIHLREVCDGLYVGDFRAKNSTGALCLLVPGGIRLPDSYSQDEAVHQVDESQDRLIIGQSSDIALHPYYRVAD